MDIKLTNACLFVKDIEVSKKFYVENLHQKIQQSMERYVVFTSGLALWELPSESIIAKKLQTQSGQQSNNRVELYFESEDVDLYFDRLRNRQVNFLHEIHEEPWGQRDFRFFYPDNNLIEIGESMTLLPLRLYNSGMSVDQISAKTGMSKEHILDIVKHK